jgi:hypothetical protein
MRRAGLCFIVVIALLAACGGDGGGSSEPSGLYPKIRGTWTIHGTFDGFPSSLAHFDGTITFDQPDLNAPGVFGVEAIRVIIDADTTEVVSIDEISLSPDSVLSFKLAVPNTTTTWTFIGNGAGRSYVGRHLLAGTSTQIPGDWQATKN